MPQDAESLVLAASRSPAVAAARWLVRRASRFFHSVLEWTQSDANLFVGLLLLNAVVRPYSGLIHDAQLYAFQIMDRVEGGKYADDLYLLHGSQDAYSIFSHIVSPLAGWLGLETTFFLCYLITIAALLYAFQRFVLKLVQPRSVAVIALLFLAVAPVSFAGVDVFHVNETFLTARLVAEALVLFGLERLLCGRYAVSLAFILVALLFHPIMAFSGLLTWVGCLSLHYLSRRQLAVVVLALTAGGLILVSFPALGICLLGHMDPVWREAALGNSSIARPQVWEWNDHARILMAFVIAGIAGWHLPRQSAERRLTVVIELVAAAGMLGALLATYLPYAILFQGQPYRALWLLQLVQYPLGAWLIATRWNRGGMVNQLLLLSLAVCLVMDESADWGKCLTIALGTLCVLKLASVRWSPRWLIGSFLSGILAIQLGWAAISIVTWTRHSSQLSEFVEPQLWWYVAFGLLGPLLTIVATIVVLAGLIRLFGRRCRAALVTACLLVQTVAYFIPHSRLYQRLDMQPLRELQFVKDFFKTHYSEGSGVPTIHWPALNPKRIWFDLRAKSYFSWVQMAGAMFNRDTALEGHRRAQLVARFDLEALRTQLVFSAPWVRAGIGATYEAEAALPPPTLADLHRLCLEEPLDYAVLRHRFDGLYAATDGRWYIYDCAEVRRRLSVNEQISRISN
jgi:hypothetical protein